MIPKKIHYCWFGDKELPKQTLEYIQTWKEKCPDYEIIEWNEDNFDIYENEYTAYCHINKKYAYLSDYVRLKVIYEQGGIYLDTDIEVLKSFDDLLRFEGFLGFMDEETVSTGLGFGSIPHHPVIKKLLDEYNSLGKDYNGEPYLRDCSYLNTKALNDLGLRFDGTLQTIFGIKVFPKDYFNPLDIKNNLLETTENTYTIHYYTSLWMTPVQKVTSKIVKPFYHIGQKIYKKFK